MPNAAGKMFCGFSGRFWMFWAGDRNYFTSGLTPYLEDHTVLVVYITAMNPAGAVEV